MPKSSTARPIYGFKHATAAIRNALKLAAPGVPKDAVEYYIDVFRKVRETPEWKKFMSDGAFNTTFMSGPEYVKWVEKAEATHRGLMKEAGFLAK